MTEPSPIVPKTAAAGTPWLRAFLLSGLIFVSGAVAGGAITYRTLWQNTRAGFAEPRFRPGPIRAELHRDLELSAEQDAAIGEILDAHHATMRAIHDEVRVDVDAALAQLRADVEAVLTPEQAAMWNRRFERMQDRWMPPGPPDRGRMQPDRDFRRGPGGFEGPDGPNGFDRPEGPRAPRPRFAPPPDGFGPPPPPGSPPPPRIPGD